MNIKYQNSFGTLVKRDNKKYISTIDENGIPILKELLSNKYEIVTFIFETINFFKKIFKKPIPIFINISGDEYGLKIEWVKTNVEEKKCFICYKFKSDIIFSVIADSEKQARTMMKDLIKTKGLK